MVALQDFAPPPQPTIFEQQSTHHTFFRPRQTPMRIQRDDYDDSTQDFIPPPTPHDIDDVMSHVTTPTTKSKNFLSLSKLYPDQHEVENFYNPMDHTKTSFKDPAKVEQPKFHDQSKDINTPNQIIQRIEYERQMKLANRRAQYSEKVAPQRAAKAEAKAQKKQEKAELQAKQKQEKQQKGKKK